MKHKIKQVELPLSMPKSVTNSLVKIWSKTGLPRNMDTICYTYGDTCYSPTPLSRDLLVHESVHTEQQARSGMTPDKWWEKVGDSPEFRYEQELEAYRKQYQYFKQVHGKIKAYGFAKFLASTMASPMYGNMCTFNQALQDILR